MTDRLRQETRRAWQALEKHAANSRDRRLRELETMFTGELGNNTEHRPALHIALRNRSGRPSSKKLRIGSMRNINRMRKICCA